MRFGCRSVVCVSQYAMITQHVVRSMLRSEAMAGGPLHDGGACLEVMLLQGALALLGCSIMHGVRFESHTSSQLHFN